jgi:hypothetical protein
MPSVPVFHRLNSDHQGAGASLAETARRVLMKIIAVRAAYEDPDTEDEEPGIRSRQCAYPQPITPQTGNQPQQEPEKRADDILILAAHRPTFHSVRNESSFADLKFLVVTTQVAPP